MLPNYRVRFLELKVHHFGIFWSLRSTLCKGMMLSNPHLSELRTRQVNVTMSIWVPLSQSVLRVACWHGRDVVVTPSDVVVTPSAVRAHPLWGHWRCTGCRNPPEEPFGTHLLQGSKHVQTFQMLLKTKPTLPVIPV